MPTSALTATNGKSNQPHNGKDNCGNPQNMHSESRAEEDQDKQ
jgi:hypothetical protein